MSPYSGHNTGFGNSSVIRNSDGDRISQNTKKLTIKKWDKKKKKMYYSNGSIVTGTVYYKNKFYAFTSSGKYRKDQTHKLRAAAKRKKDVSKLRRLLGKPKHTSYTGSCYGSGQDGIWTYRHFKVYTYREGNNEIYMGAAFRKG